METQRSALWELDSQGLILFSVTALQTLIHPNNLLSVFISSTAQTEAHPVEGDYRMGDQPVLNPSASSQGPAWTSSGSHPWAQNFLLITPKSIATLSVLKDVDCMMTRFSNHCVACPCFLICRTRCSKELLMLPKPTLEQSSGAPERGRATRAGVQTVFTKSSPLCRI